MRSPCPRGLTELWIVEGIFDAAFPVPTGINRTLTWWGSVVRSVPRAHGD